MKVFVVISDVVYDCDGEPEVAGVYTDRNKAVERMKNVFEAFKNENWFDADDENATTFNNEQCSAWRNGYYSEFHCNIFIVEKEVEE